MVNKKNLDSKKLGTLVEDIYETLSVLGEGESLKVSEKY